jgi:hypothetical protein
VAVTMRGSSLWVDVAHLYMELGPPQSTKLSNGLFLFSVLHSLCSPDS